MRANARAIASSEAGRRTENALTGAAELRERRAQQPLGAQALAELVVDLDAVPAEIARRGGALVGHRDRVEAVAARPSAAPRTHTIAVTGTWPLSAPASLSAPSPGSSRALGRAGAAGPRPRTVRAIGGASPIENSASSRPERRTISSATAESLPPPTGTSTRRVERARRGVARRPAGDLRVRRPRRGEARARQLGRLVGVGELAQALRVERLEQRRDRRRRGVRVSQTTPRRSAVLK